MQFASTRHAQQPVGFSAALTQGLATDGGLYVPTEWPTLTLSANAQDLPAVATQLLMPFAHGDALAPQLQPMAREAFNFPAPLVMLGDSGRLGVLELFHGPTAAFKDF